MESTDVGGGSVESIDVLKSSMDPLESELSVEPAQSNSDTLSISAVTPESHTSSDMLVDDSSDTQQ